MKTRILCAAMISAALTTTPALAGSDEPVLEPIVIAEDAASSSVGAGAFLILSTLIVFGAAAAN